MIERLSALPDHLVALRLEGRIAAEDIDRLTERLNQALAAHEQVSFFLEIASLERLTPKALLKDVQFGLSQIKNLRRLHRVAVVTDQEWIRTGITWTRRLFTSIHLRVFEPPEREEALAWAGETPPAAGPPKRGLEEIPTKDPGTIAVAVRGPVTGADIEHWAPRLRAAYETQGRLNLLMRMDGGYRFHLDVFSGKLARLKTDALSHIERYAVVGAPDWMPSATRLARPLLKLEPRFFDSGDEAAAWNWVGTEPAGEAAPPPARPGGDSG